MEGAPNVENLVDWRTRKEQGPTKAARLIDEIPGFAEMVPKEKIEALTKLIDELSEDNANRYIAREVALRRARIEEMDRHEIRKVELGMAA